MKIVLLIVLLIVVHFTRGQTILSQELIMGEVFGVGYDFTFGDEHTDSIDIPAQSGSLIKKFIILYNFKGEIEPNEFIVNDTVIPFNASNRIVDFFTHRLGNGTILNLSTGYIEVKEFVGKSLDKICFKIPYTQQTFNPSVFSLSGIYFIILFENTNLPVVSYTLLQNDTDAIPSKTYQLNDFNVIDSLKPVGCALNSMALCDTILDGTYIKVNNTNLGLMGGDDPHAFNGCGTIGNFRYRNDSLYGLSDDLPHLYFNGTDGLGDIRSVLLSNNNFDVKISYQTPSHSNPNAPYTNTIWNMHFTHSTPCDTFMVNLIDQYQVCLGDSVQMQVTSAPLSNHTYEWEPQEGLSCYNCAQPYFTDTVSRWYTVRIWNNDSCSKVLPVRVEVLEKPIDPIVSVSPTKCSDSSGTANVQVVESSYEYILNNGVPQTSNIFNNLFAGNHLVSVIDINGCQSSTPITILETYPNAVFSATPQQGDVPLEVSFYNTSTGANNFIWYIEQDTLYSVNATHTFNTEGYFDATLVVYDTYPWCSDTANVKIFAEYPFTIFAPSLQDDKDGNYQIYTSGVKSLSYHLYNALGQIIYTKELDASQGYQDLWSAYTVAKGTYVFRIVAKGENGEEKVVSGKVVVI